MTNPTPGVAGAMQCANEGGEPCAASGPGHAIGAIQQRVARATPSKWRDGIVHQVADGGWISVALIDGDAELLLWHHEPIAGVVAGQPVAVHALYNTLALGDERFNVLIAAALPIAG